MFGAEHSLWEELLWPLLECGRIFRRIRTQVDLGNCIVGRPFPVWLHTYHKTASPQGSQTGTLGISFRVFKRIGCLFFGADIVTDRLTTVNGSSESAIDTRAMDSSSKEGSLTAEGWGIIVSLHDDEGFVCVRQERFRIVSA